MDMKTDIRLISNEGIGGNKLEIGGGGGLLFTCEFFTCDCTGGNIVANEFCTQRILNSDNLDFILTDNPHALGLSRRITGKRSQCLLTLKASSSCIVALTPFLNSEAGGTELN